MKHKSKGTLMGWETMSDGQTLEQKAIRVGKKHWDIGQKIKAIKEVRELTGWGLRESKKFCEDNFNNGESS